MGVKLRKRLRDEEATSVTIELIRNSASAFPASLISALIPRCHQLHIQRSFGIKLDLVPSGVDPETISVLKLD
jgi:hypothetical protein